MPAESFFPPLNDPRLAISVPAAYVQTSTWWLASRHSSDNLIRQNQSILQTANS
jgi:hypothetical protein